MRKDCSEVRVCFEKECGRYWLEGKSGRHQEDDMNPVSIIFHGRYDDGGSAALERYAVCSPTCAIKVLGRVQKRQQSDDLSEALGASVAKLVNGLLEDLGLKGDKTAIAAARKRIDAFGGPSGA